MGKNENKTKQLYINNEKEVETNVLQNEMVNC